MVRGVRLDSSGHDSALASACFWRTSEIVHALTPRLLVTRRRETVLLDGPLSHKLASHLQLPADLAQRFGDGFPTDSWLVAIRQHTSRMQASEEAPVKKFRKPRKRRPELQDKDAMSFAASEGALVAMATPKPELTKPRCAKRARALLRERCFGSGEDFLELPRNAEDPKAQEGAVGSTATDALDFLTDAKPGSQRRRTPADDTARDALGAALGLAGASWQPKHLDNFICQSRARRYRGARSLTSMSKGAELGRAPAGISRIFARQRANLAVLEAAGRCAQKLSRLTTRDDDVEESPTSCASEPEELMAPVADVPVLMDRHIPLNGDLNSSVAA